MKTLSMPLSKEAKHANDEVAALLSIVPGLGHIYKGHYEAGLLWMFLGMPCRDLDRHHIQPGNRWYRPALSNRLLGGTGV